MSTAEQRHEWPRRIPGHCHCVEVRVAKPPHEYFAGELITPVNWVPFAITNAELPGFREIVRRSGGRRIKVDGREIQP